MCLRNNVKREKKDFLSQVYYMNYFTQRLIRSRTNIGSGSVLYKGRTRLRNTAYLERA